MQSLQGLSTSDLLAKVKVPLVKFEVYHGAGNYIATMTFDSGSVEPQVNEVLTGATSSAWATVISVTLVSGAWTDGDATGTINLGFCYTRFYDNENINGSIGGTNILTVNNPDTAVGVDGHVINGGMELNDDWVDYGTPYIPTGRSGEFKRVGSYSWRIAPDGANDGMQMDTDVYATLIRGKTYRIQAWIYWRDTNPDPPGTALFKIGFTGDGTAVLDITSKEASLSRDTWGSVSFTAKCTTGGTVRFYVCFVSATKPGDPGYYIPVFYVDDVTIYEDESWANLCDLDGVNYLDDWSISLGGAKMLPDPIAGTWNAVINNKDGMFHPDHPSSFYSDLFEEGKKIRISLGATYSSLDYYWQRLIGYMEEPSYKGKTNTVNISGFDYMKVLMDTELKKPDNYWGTSVTFSSIASEGTLGAEIYAQNDAMEIGGGEANNVTNWSTLLNATFVSQADTGAGSTWVGKMNNTTDDNYVANLNIGSVTYGTKYKLSFKYRRVIGSGNLAVIIYQSVGGAWTTVAEFTQLNAETYTLEEQFFMPVITGAVKMELNIEGDAGEEFRIDEISLKSDAGQWKKYDMPAACNGVYRVVLDSVEVFQDAEDEGWFYDPVLNKFYFDEAKTVEAGTNNLIVYYYTDQDLENVVADLLVDAGLYATQAAALTGMDYTATGISVPKVFFKAGDNCLNAVRLCCERANYRFFFQYDGTPDFNPAPTAEVAGSEDVALHEGNYSKPNYRRDKSEIWNRVVIEGLEQGQRVSPKEAMESELKGEENDATSIAAYGEHTKTIKNDLFQDQTLLDAMCVTLLALRKDPEYYFDFTLDYNALPLELGDTVRWQLVLAIGTGKRYNTFKYGDGTVYGGGGVVVVKRGIIRDITINRYNVQYKCQEVT